MARDRNVTVWQAYVTVMSIVSFLCLGALAYMMFTSGTNLKTAEAAIKDKQNAEANLRKVTDRNQLLQSILGVGKPLSEAEFDQLKTSVTGDAEIDAAIKTYTNHMGLFGANEPEKNYAKLVDTLMQELRSGISPSPMRRPRRCRTRKTTIEKSRWRPTFAFKRSRKKTRFRSRPRMTWTITLRKSPSK